MYRYDSPIVAIVVVILMLIMTTDAKVLCGIICIPAGIVMLKQCRKVNEKMLKIMI